MVNRAEAGGFQPDQESGVQTPELSIENIRQAALDLKQKVAQGKLLKEQDLEEKVKNHEELNSRLQELRTTLAAAKETQDYFNSIDAAGELPADSRPQLEEINATVANLENQLGQIESKINFMAAQPQILDRLHEMALKERDGELKEQEIKRAIDELSQENDRILQEINALAQEEKATLDEQRRVQREQSELESQLRQSIQKALSGLEYKHTTARNALSGSIPTVAKLETARSELGMFDGKQKAAMDIMLNHRAELERYQALSIKHEELTDKIYKGLPQKRKEMVDRIKKHMLKAWEVHDKTGIPHGWSTGGIDVPGTVYRDLEGKVEKLADVKKVGESGQKKEIDHANPAQQALYRFWNSMHGYDSENNTLSGVRYSRPEIK